MDRQTSPLKAVRRLVLAAVVAAASGAGPAAGAGPAPRVVQDPHYGDTLFHFYQERYFTAVTNLMVSQHFNRLTHHVDEAEVLRGGLLLSYGMHREAGEIFAQLIEKGAAPPVRDRAWYYLAKIRYQRGFFDEADAALQRIEKNLPPDLEEERLLLKANVLMARGDYAAAADSLKEPVDVLRSKGGRGETSAGQYIRYNLGVALVRSGVTGRGTILLNEIGRASTPENVTEEFRSLRDRANVALGFTALKEGKPESAFNYLQRVRLNGMQSNKALLGFGWASAAMKDYRQALVPWAELAQRDASDAAVLEAHIALPYAFAQLGAYGQALERYNQALAAFERENKALDESIAAIRAGKLVEGLMERNPGEEMGWFWNIDELPQLPHAGHLTPVLAQHDFQEAFKNYRDLQFLVRNLKQWQDSLGVMGDMLENRRKAYAERLPRVLAKARDSGLRALTLRGGVLASELADVEVQEDGAAFADAKERELIERLLDARATLKAAGRSPEIQAARERLRLVEGAMTWRLAQAYPARLWEAKKALQGVQEGLAEAAGREAAMAQAQRDEPARFDRFAERIAELGKRIQVLVPRVAGLSQEQREAVQELAVSELNRQKERLAIYTVQARFAVAQLYDQAGKARGADDATK